MTSANWTDERTSTLKTLWLQGLSATQVAARLGGVTRNAVIGKVHRLGLGGRVAPSAPARIARAPMIRPRPPRALATPRARTVVTPACEPVLAGPGLFASLSALTAHACKWPLGDPKAPDFSFCGRAAAGAYCPAHQAQAVRPGPVWRPDRDPTVRRALAGLI